MSWLLTNLFSAFLLPPLNLFLLALAGLLLWRKRPVLARWLSGISLLLLWLLATPVIANFLLQRLEDPATALPVPASADLGQLHAEAIVVLGGGIYAQAPEYAGDTVSTTTLQRLRYAALLAHQTRLPLLVSGGTPTGSELAEADLMAGVLEQEFNVPVQWKETRSDNTLQSADHSYRILNEAGVRHILLVTDAWHMPRAVNAFRHAGFQVIPAPTAFTTRYRIDLLALLPDAGALLNSRIFCHELIGRLWYKLKY